MLSFKKKKCISWGHLLPFFYFKAISSTLVSAGGGRQAEGILEQCRACSVGHHVHFLFKTYTISTARADLAYSFWSGAKQVKPLAHAED